MGHEDLSQTLKVGDLLSISTGEYSDYSVCGPVRIIRPFVKHEVCEAYRKTYPKQKAWGLDEDPDPFGFLPWLISEGYAEDIDGHTEWHVGSYGRFEP